MIKVFIPVKTIERFDGTYIQHHSYGTYIQTFTAEEYLVKMKTHFINIIENLQKYKIFVENEINSCGGF